MNAVLTLTHNCLSLTTRCISSVLKQDIPTEVYIFDNGSTDGTAEWIQCNFFDRARSYSVWRENKGVSFGWNSGLKRIFEDHDHCLVIGNDTWLPPKFYSELMSRKVPFVTGVAVDNMEQALQEPERKPLTDNPDFSAFFITRECWEKIGPFDERFKHYCGDCDMHVRAHRLGVRLCKSDQPYFHERSSTIRLATPEDRNAIESQANQDRAVFRELYGCLPGQSAYEEMFK